MLKFESRFIQKEGFQVEYRRKAVKIEGKKRGLEDEVI